MSADLPIASAASAPSRPKRDAALAVAFLAGATVVGFVLDQRASLTSEAMVYVLAVVLASYTISRTAALLSAAAAVVCLNFFFIEPRHTLQVDAPENVAAL